MRVVHYQVEECVEALCQKGCRSVHHSIRALESGQGLPETEELTEEEVAKVLKELKSVMSVYGDICRPHNMAS